MKKIYKVLLVCLMAVTLFACSSDESDVKKVVSSYLDCIKAVDFEGAAAITGESVTDVLEGQTEDQKALMKLMFQKFDYNITDVKVNEEDAIVYVDVTNVKYIDLKNKAAQNLEESNADFQNLDENEKIKQLLAEETKLIESVEPNTYSVTVKLVKNEDEEWEMTSDNSAFANALVGDQ